MRTKLEFHVKKILKTAVGLLTGSTPAVAGIQIAAALVAGTLLLIRPATAARILPWALWLIFLLAGAALFAAGWENPRRTRWYWLGAGAVIIAAVTIAFQVRGDYLASWGAGVWALNSAVSGFRRAFEGSGTPLSRGLSFAEAGLLATTGILFFFRFDRAFFETAPFYTLFFYADAMIRLASTPWRKAHK